jgi:ubiquinone/menaquinone biosynthesis C-methylase UbiE
MLTRTPVFIKAVGVGEHLPFHSHRFSFVSAVGLMEYVRQPEQVLAETVRVSRPPARLLVTSSPVTVVNSFRRVFGAKLYLRADEEVAQLLECAGLEILRHSKTLMQSQWLVRIAGDRRVVNAKN